jgi:hypothetical protein
VIRPVFPGVTLPAPTPPPGAPASQPATGGAGTGGPVVSRPAPASVPRTAPALTRPRPPGGEPMIATTPAPRPAMPPTLPTSEREKPTQPSSEDLFGWKGMDKSEKSRIIAVNLDKLKTGDPRMNIIVRNQDIVQIPSIQVGEFYIMGEVSRPGVYSLTGRLITVKQALAAAGNLGDLSWPENSILIRRIGQNQEQIIPLNLEAICRGDEPDVYLKADDVLAVGTDVRAPFLAVLRNAFRLTYGFGFIWDRNFADPLFTTPTSKRFTRL